MAKKGLELSRDEKAAVIFLCMDEEASAQMFSQMKDDEIKRVGSALLKLKRIPAAQMEETIAEFVDGMLGNVKLEKPSEEKFEDVKIDGKIAAKNLIERSIDIDRGEAILSTLGQAMPASEEELGNFGVLVQQYPSNDLYKIFKDEHPQVIAIVLLYAKRNVIREILDKFEENIIVEIVSRMASVEKISKKVIDELTAVLMQDMEEKAKAGKGTIGATVEEEEEEEEIEGFGNTIKVLKTFKESYATEIIEKIEGLDDQLGKNLYKNMFTMEDFLRAEDAGMRELLRGITNDDLKYALKDASEALQDKFFGNMSERAAKIIREDMEVLPALKVEEIETASENIISVAKQLIKDEKLILAEIEDDEE